MKALITENSRVYRQLLDTLFGQHGFEIDISDSIETSRDFVNSQDYDVICVNHHLKDGSGLDFVDYCNKHERQKNAAILLLTSNRKSVVSNGSIHVDEVIPKINLQQITDQITRFVDGRFDPVFSEGKILFVEDGHTISTTIMGLLAEKGYSVVHHSKAETAWQAFEAESSFGSAAEAFDLVLTDILLEGKMSGSELVSNIRALDDARGFIPIIAMTSDTSKDLRLSLYQQGINDFIQKPPMPEELAVRISNLITNKRLVDKVHDIRRELFELATVDQLTGCHNRRSLMDFSEKFIYQARRYGFSVCLMVIDLDHFKQINDNHGHIAGDKVLKTVGGLLVKSFREGDLVARFGGEEFVVLMSHCDKKPAMDKAEELRSKIETLSLDELNVTTSIGVTTTVPGLHTNFELMFSAADRGVYRAKEGGRNRVVFEALQNSE